MSRFQKFLGRYFHRRPWSQRNDPYYELVGMVTVTWAFIEMTLDHFNEVVLPLCDDSNLQKRVPTALAQKIEFFRAVHLDLTMLQPFEAEGVTIAEALDLQKEARHALVHSILPSDRGGFDGHRELVRYVYRNKRREVVATLYNHDQGWEIHSAAMKLMRRLADHTGAVARALSPLEFDPT